MSMCRRYLFISCIALGVLSSRLLSAEESSAPWKRTCLDIIPTPKQCLASGREFRLGPDAKVVVVAGRDTAILQTAARTIGAFLARKGLRNVEFTARHDRWPEADLTVVLGGPEANPLFEERPGLMPDAKPRAQGYVLRTWERSRTPSRIAAAVLGADDVGTLYGAYTFLKSLHFSPQGVVIKELQVADEPALQVRGLSPQWAWYIGERAPYGAALWGLDRWKMALDFMAEHRLNVLALCTYGKFPFPLERYRSRCAVDLEFQLWNPAEGLHTVRWTHPAFKDDFLGELVKYAHDRGIRVLIYSCLNLQDEIGSHQWTNEAEVAAYCDIQQRLLKRYGIDGFVFESGEFQVMDPQDLARFGNDEWTRLKADLFLTRRYTEAIRAAKPDATIGLVDHYLFKDWDEKKVPQRVGLERWKQELPPETLVAYVHSPEAYDVFPPDRIWTYVFGPKGGLKPALQIHLADSCDVPREKKAAGAYYVTYDWSPHEPDYLCFAESAWGNYGASDQAAFKIHSSERGVGGDISGRAWNNIKHELYGEGGEFGEGLLTAAQGTFKGMWDPQAVLRKAVFENLAPRLDEGDFHRAAELLVEVGGQRALTEKGLALMRAHRGQAASVMVSDYSVQEHLEKAILLAQAQLAWAEYVCWLYRSVIELARNPEAGNGRQPEVQIQEAAQSPHAAIRESLSRAYFSYPHDLLGKFEFLAGQGPFSDDLARLRTRFSMQMAPGGTRFRLFNVAPRAIVTADSNFPSKYGPGYYEPKFAADGREGTAAKGIWVSAETPGEHFLELRFARPPLVRGVVVNWVRDAGHDWTPRDFSVEVCVDKQWKFIANAKDNKASMSVTRVNEPTRLGQMRIVITRGSSSRPCLAAINEVQVLAVKE